MTTVDERERWAYIALGCLAEPGRRDLYAAIRAEGPIEALRRFAGSDNARLDGRNVWDLAQSKSTRRTGSAPGSPYPVTRSGRPTGWTTSR